MDIIRWLQASASPTADAFWGAITDLNGGDLGIIVISIIFWCVNAWQGWLFGNLIVGTMISNEVLKAIIAVARPDPTQVRVIRQDTAPGSSFPSGHSQLATVFWGYFGWLLKRPVVGFLTGLMVLLTAASRLYLGLHWPTDVLGGLVVGVVILLLGIRLSDKWVRSSEHNLSQLIRVLFVVVPVIGFILIPSRIMTTVAGIGLGFNLGYLWLLPRQFATAPVEGDMRSRLVKGVVGVVGVLLLRAALKAVFPDTALFDFIRYAVVGLWIGWLAPLLFTVMFRTAARPAMEKT
jgi:membrane-associated phospholipid phosphatase